MTAFAEAAELLSTVASGTASPESVAKWMAGSADAAPAATTSVTATSQDRLIASAENTVRPASSWRTTLLSFLRRLDELRRGRCAPLVIFLMSTATRTGSCSKCWEE